MKGFFFSLLFFCFVKISGASESEIIYGNDHRIELTQVKSTFYRHLSQATAAMISKDLLTSNSDSLFKLRSMGTLKEVMNLCDDQRFINQPVLASCSGFLVAPDTLLTAGHCLKSNFSFEDPQTKCQQFIWYFNFQEQNVPDDFGLNSIAKNDIYGCEKIIFPSDLELYDFALVKLKSKAVGRRPLMLRKKGTILENAKLIAIGHPSGLPKKIVEQGGILSLNQVDPVFYTSLDTFSANSGSPVINRKTGLVEGVLLEGNHDYILSNPEDPFSCLKANICRDDGSDCGFPSSLKGEGVLRISEVLRYL